MHKESLYNFYLYLLILILISFFYGFRDLSIGYDSYVYAMNFIYIEDHHFSFEPFFDFFTKTIRFFTSNYSIYFSLICLIILVNYLILNFLIYKKELFKYRFLIIISFLISSTWVLTIITNAMRQGVGLSFLFIFLWLFLNKKYKLSIFFLIPALLSHGSIILFILIFGLLLIKNNRIYFFLVGLFSIFYPLGINENIVNKFSQILGIDLYDKIKNYAVAADAWVGFQLNFYLYTIFWFLCFSAFYRYVNKDECYLILLKIYSFLMVLYFLFGFGGYSNRYAFFCWAFLPVLQAKTLITIFDKWKVPKEQKIFLITLVFFGSIFIMFFNLGYLNVF